MALTVGRARLRLHPLAPLFLAAAILVGAGKMLLVLAISLAVHEAAHLTAAKALGVGVEQIQILPFGGAIRLENPYVLSPGRLLAVAAAGPAGSLLAVLTAAALAHWRVLPPMFALELMETNLALALFNLLPALPLDGGRMLYALLSERVGRDRAVQAGIVAGRLAAGPLLALAVAPLFLGVRLNLSPIFASAFILASARDERRALGEARMKAYLNELRPLADPIPARMVAVGGDCDARAALRAARADALTLYAVYEGSRLTSFTDDRRLLEGILNRNEVVQIRDIVGPTAHRPHPG